MKSKSQARKDYWASISPLERSSRMRKIAIERQKKYTPEERKQLSIRMVEAKRAKLNNK